MLKLKLLIGFLLLGVYFPLNGQVPSAPSADAANLGKYGQVPVNLYTGKVNIEVPIYNLNSGALNLPIFLSYFADAIKPNEQVGWVGLNWSLNAGGVITRVIKGYKDEQVGYGGYFQNRENVNYYWEKPVVSWSQYWDGEPDIFYFNFNGHSGKFILGHDGKFNVIPYNQWSIVESINSAQMEGFTITIEDGTKYIFGMNYHYIETSQPEGSDIINTSWYLNKIVSATGIDTIEFEYINRDEDNMSLVQYIIQKSSSITTGEYTSTPNGWAWSQGNCYNIIDGYEQRIRNSRIFLKYIKTKEAIIRFNSSVANSMAYDILYSNIKSNRKLDEIQIVDRNSNSVLKNYVLSYFEEQSKRLMLKNVQEVGSDLVSSGSKYEFEYYDYSQPMFQVDNVDHWGYYNAHPNPSLIPSIHVDEGKIVYGSEREPNGTVANIGLLKTIHYPTSGFSTFDYEPNDYAYIEERNPDNFATPILSEASDKHSPAGGVRIRKITTSDGNNISFKEYKYIKDYIINKNGFSSGVLGTKPIYYFHYDLPEGNFLISFAVLARYSLTTNTCSSIIPLVTTQGSHIGYSEVTEIRSDGSFTVNKFSGFAEKLDKPATRNLDPTNVFSKFQAINYMDLERGKLLSQEDFSNSGNPLGSKYMTYNSDPNRFSQSIHAFEQSNPVISCPFANSWFCGYEIYTYPYYLESETERVYGSGQNSSSYIETITNYKYDSPEHKLLSEIKTIDSKGNTQIKQYKYPQDFDPSKGTNGSMGKLVLKNIKSPIIESLTWLNDKLVEGKCIDYDDFTGCIMPKYEYVLETVNPIASLNMDLPINADPAIPNALFKEKKSFNFNKDKLIDYKDDKNSTTTAFIWGNNQISPIAKVANALSTQIAYTGFENPEEMGGWNFTYFSSDECQNTCSIEANTARNTCENECTPSCYSCGSNNECWSSCLSGCISNCQYQVYSNCLLTCSYSVASGSAKVGSKSFVGSNISSNTLPFGSYKISCWLKNSGTIAINGNSTTISNNSWGYKEFIVNNVTAVSINLSGLLMDELRIYPVDALMTTYTYKPLVGITSQTNPNGITTYYEYDLLGRLKLVKDHDGKILKQYKYHYQNQ